MSQLNYMKQGLRSLIGPKLYGALKASKSLKIINAKQHLRSLENHFLNEVDVVFHIGANQAQECLIYNLAEVSVFWIEADPNLQVVIKNNIAEFRNQHLKQALLWHVDNENINFNVANNGGNSSSVFDLCEHNDLFPGVEMVENIPMKTTTFTTLIEGWDIAKEAFNKGNNMALVMDVQGAELNVLKGLGPFLEKFSLLKIEAANFPAYNGSTTDSEIAEYLIKLGFKEVNRHVIKALPDGRSYFDIEFKMNSIK